MTPPTEPTPSAASMASMESTPSTVSMPPIQSIQPVQPSEGTFLGGAGMDSAQDRDAMRCRRVENALYRRAKGYKVALKKTFKVKRVEYDPTTGKKVAEREELESGIEEVHIPADVRVCAYYLNNRDPARWQEHPQGVGGDEPDGVVLFPPMESPAPDPDEGGGTGEGGL